MPTVHATDALLSRREVIRCCYGYHATTAGALEHDLYDRLRGTLAPSGQALVNEIDEVVGVQMATEQIRVLLLVGTLLMQQGHAELWRTIYNVASDDRDPRRRACFSGTNHSCGAPGRVLKELRAVAESSERRNEARAARRVRSRCDECRVDGDLTPLDSPSLLELLVSRVDERKQDKRRRMLERGLAARWQERDLAPGNRSVVRR